MNEVTCAICGKRTRKFQRYCGSYWHCSDGCFATTGVDRRTPDGKPMTPNRPIEPEYPK